MNPDQIQTARGGIAVLRTQGHHEAADLLVGLLDEALAQRRRTAAGYADREALARARVHSPNPGGRYPTDVLCWAARIDGGPECLVVPRRRFVPEPRQRLQFRVYGDPPTAKQRGRIEGIDEAGALLLSVEAA